MTIARDLADFADSATASSDSIYTPVATGALANGQAVVLNSDGTVQTVSPATSSNSTPTAWGGSSRTNSSNSDTVNDDAWYDPNSNTVVVVYSDSTNGYYGTAIVGTISGTTITFGSPLIFSSALTSWCRVEKNYSYSDKVVIAWVLPDSSYGLYVETFNISGTTITANESFPYQRITGCYMPRMITNLDTYSSPPYIYGRVYIAYSDSLGSLYGKVLGFQTNDFSTSLGPGGSVVFASESTGQKDFLSINPDQQPANTAIVCTQRNDSTAGLAAVITFDWFGYVSSVGTLTYITPTNQFSYPQMAYDPSSGKYLVAVDGNKFNPGADAMESYLLTVDGTDVTASTATPWASRPDYNHIYQFTVVASNGQVVIFYRDDASPNYPKYVVGTISGSSVSYGQTFTADTTTMGSTSIPISVYDSNNSQAIIFYSDSFNPLYTMIDNAPSTAPNFIGITNEAIADGEAGVVSLKGSINQSVTGLTTQADYYVQEDGALSTTVSATPAGKALSPTSILLKGI